MPAARTVLVAPGAAISFEGACAGGAGPLAHAWTFQGGTPAASASAVPGPVTFAAAGSHQVTYRCTDAQGRGPPELTRTIQVGPVPSAFAIRLQVVPAAQPYQADFEWAAARVAELVIGPAPGMADDPRDPALCGAVAVPTDLGHLAVLASVEPLDGFRGLVALSGPCALRTSDGLPVAGVVRIDSADAPVLQAGGTLRAVLLHELLHVLGFGTLWGAPAPGQPGLDLLGEDRAAGALFHRGAEARAAFRDFNGGAAFAGTPVPVEGALGAATRGSHWNAGVFGTELMGPSVIGASPALSRTTLQSLADLGWQVDGSRADPFLIPVAVGAALAPGGAAEAVDLEGDVHGPPPRLLRD